jgi:hypothetical protein
MMLPWDMFGENLTTAGLQEARPLPGAQRLISVYPRAEADGPQTTQSRRPAHILRISQQHQSYRVSQAARTLRAASTTQSAEIPAARMSSAGVPDPGKPRTAR